MTPMSQALRNIKAIHTLAKQAFHRRMVVISGSHLWCMRLIENYLSLQNSFTGFRSETYLDKKYSSAK